MTREEYYQIILHYNAKLHDKGLDYSKKLQEWLNEFSNKFPQ